MGLALYDARGAGIAFCDVPAQGSAQLKLRYTPPQRGRPRAPGRPGGRVGDGAHPGAALQGPGRLRQVGPVGSTRLQALRVVTS